MRTEPTVIHLKDYQPHPFQIQHSELHFELIDSATVVTARHQVNARGPQLPALELDSEEMRIEWIQIDGVTLSKDRWRHTGDRLVIDDVPDSFELGIRNYIDPSANTRLSGLYRSGGMFCTQCEAEGFRRITPSIDRPDNLATYRVTLSADRETCPVLLCNGNREQSINANPEDAGRHSVTWYDPFPKPTYLFALVAGSLSELKSTFTTRSGRTVGLHFFARDRDIEKCEYAMDALKRSMRWDEDVYGREYDLDLFNVVAVSDFNMGAMENKSLNIFNTKYVLADADTATDLDFFNVERVIAHEYFHNWSGNRITCRDWFQLSLKEGFTVFRDQQFSADMGSSGVQRIGDVNVLRNHQFAEDAGPMAHPVRPTAYSEINNFYTVTIYEKGAEIVRMLHTLTGVDGFRKGTDLYFDRHDGQAVTTDDFVAAIGDANELDLEQFKNWYRQAGTPVVEITTHYDADTRSLTIDCVQSCPDTPGQTDKDPFVIPLSIALFSPQGEKLYPKGSLPGEILNLSQSRQQFVIEDIAEQPVLSALRQFSAPVKIQSAIEEEALLVMFRHDDDPFNRWEAGQKLFEAELLTNIARLKAERPCRWSAPLTEAIGALITDPGDDLAYAAKLLSLPGESWLGQLSKPIAPGQIAEARCGLKQHIAGRHLVPLTALYESLQSRNTGEINPRQAATRLLRDVCLDYLGSLDIRTSHLLAIAQLEKAQNMTDRMSALTVMASSSSDQRQHQLDAFYNQWQHEELVMDKWFRVQATASRPDALGDVIKLTTHSDFDSGNPNKVYALIMGFSHGNPAGFNREDGAGYDFLADWTLKLDQINPQIAARLVSGFNAWRDMVPELAAAMQARLQRISGAESLSTDVREIVSRALAAN